MSTNNMILAGAAMLAAMLMSAAVARGEDLGAVKERMLKRREAVQTLVTRARAGENNRGYLEARGAVTDAERGILADENEDRRAVYNEIAVKTGAAPEQVGKQRATAIAERLPPGAWLQDAKGQWRRK
ncbi:MAG: DUF1318 domain-containing protein [Kiritimatiellae bacterium]|nr:DUF1318 domain-containing protein [Kiritimatiellia bacterium]